MFRNVQYASGYFTAIDTDDNKVIIQESLAFMFIKTVDKPGQISYMPITYRDVNTLDLIRDYLTNYQPETGLLPRIVVRYGWMDKCLNSMSFKPLLELIDNDRISKVSPIHRRKLNEICKLLALSRKRIYKFPIQPITSLDVSSLF